MKEGKLIIVTAPSGAGKTTIVKHLLATIPSLAFSVSATTRPMRNSEVDGRDYYFISVDTFKQKIAAHEFVEWEEVYPGKMYGTLIAELERIWDSGRHIIFDVDVKGAMSLKSKYPERTLSIFIKPPSVDVLIERLRARNTETPETLQTRIEKVHYELSFESKFDKVIVNDVLENSLQQAFALVNNFLTGNGDAA